MRAFTLHDPALVTNVKRIDIDYFGAPEVWFKADSLSLAHDTAVGAAGTEWVDSINGARMATQGTAANRPLFKTNQFNGLPALDFDGTNDTLTINSGFATTQGADNITVAIVAQQDGGQSSAFLSSASDFLSYHAYPDPADTVGWMRTSGSFVSTGNSAPGGTSDLRVTWYAINTISSATAVTDFYLNSRPNWINQSSGTNGFTGTISVISGCPALGGYFFNGRIAEIVIWRTELTAGQIYDLGRFYFKPKWGLRGTYDP